MSRDEFGTMLSRKDERESRTMDALSVAKDSVGWLERFNEFLLGKHT